MSSAYQAPSRSSGGQNGIPTFPSPNHLTCLPQGKESNASSVFTEAPRTTIVSLQQRTEYGFQVRARTSRGWGEFTEPVYGTTGQLLGTGETHGAGREGAEVRERERGRGGERGGREKGRDVECCVALQVGVPLASPPYRALNPCTRLAPTSKYPLERSCNVVSVFT